LFFEDKSGSIIDDDTLSILVTLPNVIITSHQAFLTEEALSAIAQVTLKNLDQFFAGEPLDNEICYQCKDRRLLWNAEKICMEDVFDLKRESLSFPVFSVL
jgi:D-lactate dehydrogenase